MQYGTYGQINFIHINIILRLRTSIDNDEDEKVWKVTVLSALCK